MRLPIHAQFARRLRAVAERMRVGIHTNSDPMLMCAAAKAIDDLAAKYTAVCAERDVTRAELKANRDGWLP